MKFGLIDKYNDATKNESPFMCNSKFGNSFKIEQFFYLVKNIKYSQSMHCILTTVFQTSAVALNLKEPCVLDLNTHAVHLV